MTAILTNRITPAQFVAKWRPVTLTERSAAHSHFLDLCQMFDHPTPIEMDPTGREFTFEKGVHKAGGGEGFADVWKRGFFAWEYKKRKRNLDEALGQLSRYALALENPPLQIVCDTERFRIVTAYTNSVPKSYDLSLDEILDHEKRGWLEAAFWEPKRLIPGGQRSDVTKRAADKFSTLVQRLQAKGYAPEDVAHFVNRLVFLFFAEDVRLLKDGYFRRTITELAGRPSDAHELLTGLFRTFRKGGRFGLDRLPHINGGLFDDREALPLDEHEIGLLKAASSQDWAHIDPTIFGTLFERFLDPGKRAQIGAHYTDAGKIGQIIEPVVLRPLREEWCAARADIEALVKKASAKGAKSKNWQRAEERRSIFMERLRTLSILDPACGSGNFLYLVLRGVKDLEHIANQECESMGLPPRIPLVGPEILHGIEVNPLAAELARTTIWIGDIQWGVQNGFNTRPEPILRTLNLIENRDAILDERGSEASWPDAAYIVGNPPFLGGKLLRSGLGDEYVKKLRANYSERLPGYPDLVCYWFEKAYQQILSKKAVRAGLVATSSITGGDNRRVLDLISSQDFLQEAYSKQPWIVEGAQVHVSIVIFGVPSRTDKRLDGVSVKRINSDLTASSADLTTSLRLHENYSLCFEGSQPHGKFDVDGELGRKWLRKPTNPNGRSNSDILFPYLNAMDLVRRPSDRWIVDLSNFKEEQHASYFEAPFEHVKKYVYPERILSSDERKRRLWWVHHRSRPALKTALQSINRAIATPIISKHRIFRWIDKSVYASNLIDVITRDDDTSFGVLHSKFHESWALRLGTALDDRPRYTPTTTFETFPFPEGLTPNLPAASYAADPRAIAIAEAAAELDRLRENWLNPPDLVRVEPEVVPGYPDRVLPRDAAAAAELKKRTLTSLYNARPTWLATAHERLDAAVAAAYGWPEDISTEDALAALLELNRERAAAQGKA